MDIQHPIDLGQIAHELHLPLDRVQKTVELLDDGNTVPFITRYRREQTGGLDEDAIRFIADDVKRMRQLAERKQTILKTIEAQGKLTPELKREIEQAHHLKRLEDLYLPYKVKKQTLATQARERGLEPLAMEILAGDPVDLEARLTQLVDAEKGLANSTDVLEGLQHIIAERISERADLRGRLRRIFFRSGRLVTTKIEKPVEQTPLQEESNSEDSATAPQLEANLPLAEAGPVVSTSLDASETDSIVTHDSSVATDSEPLESEAVTEEEEDESDAEESENESEGEEATSDIEPREAGLPQATEVVTEVSSVVDLPAGRLFEKPETPILAPQDKKRKKKKKKKVTDNAFKDYFNFQEPLSKLPPHRILAINRGERANVLKVKIECDNDAMLREAEEVAVPREHPHAEFMIQCVRDSLTRLITPSLEREARRELSERAEGHAVEVFVRNLRKLLLQPPVHGRRVLAIDPGFKSGCKLAALDEWGNTLAHGMCFVVGRDDRKDKARQRIADLVREHKLQVIAIGNGTACRETELLVADILATELKDLDVAYVTVNEAGASVYSTSPLGREELPGYDPILRSAVSIGRRLLDPLSELVKINPANIGVGMYQHDMKTKNLRDSLDAVVESCVNYVGVDVNSASPALLRYVSGLNALTARRIYEYRREHGPFRSRAALKEVPGIGEATFVQAAGFLKILGGENPLDATWIHPESYDIAKKVLERFGSSLEELAQSVPAPPLPPPKPEKKEFGEGLVIESTQKSLPFPEESTPVAELQSKDEPIALSTEGGMQTEEAIVTAALNETTSDDAIAQQMPMELDAPKQPQQESNLPAQPPEASLPQATVPAAPVAPKVNVIAEKLGNVQIPQAAPELGISPMLLDDLIWSLCRPGRDPREELPPPVFRRGIMKLEDLQAGMEMQGTVLNVVDFGAFVDIGLSDSGLVHISRLADRFIRDPHEVVGIGDILKLWVVDVDRARRRVSLTAIAPGLERPARPQRREDRPQSERPPQARQPKQNRPPQNSGPPATGTAQTGNQQQSGNQQSGNQQAGNQQSQRPQQKPRFDRRPQQNQRPPQRDQGPRVVERPSNKPKVVKPLTKAMEDGREPLRSFSDLMQLLEKKKDKKPGEKDE